MPKQLFIKILLGFWFVTVLIAGTIVALPALVESSRKLSPEHAEFHQKITHIIQRASTLEQGIAKAKKKLSKLQRFPHIRKKKRGRFNPLYIVDMDNNAVNTKHLPRDISLAIIRHQEEPHRTGYYFKNWAVFGPYQFTSNDRQYQLYIRDRIQHHRASFLSTLKDNRWLLLFIMMAVSAICCAALAWHLVRPIKSLDRSAKKLAQGDLSVRADDVALRHRDEIGQLAQSFNDMANSVESMVQAQQRLLGDISHELRTPLTRLQLANAISRRKNGESEELTRVEQETQIIDRMLQQLLSLSRHQLANDQPFEAHYFNHFMDDIIDNASFEAKQHGIKLGVNIAPDILIDLQWEPLTSAIENIIRNAIRYADKAIMFTSVLEQDSLAITISDDGNGVPEEQLSELFNPFYRVSSARERSSGGTGLGLAIAHDAIIRHHGIISATNNHQGGLSVNIRLPLAGHH